MKLVPNMFLINVRDIESSRSFYESLFDIQTNFEAPGFVSYPLDSGVELALQADWQEPPSGHRPNTEIVLNTTLPAESIDALYTDWIAKGAVEVECPHQEIYGYTFVVSDPSGNRIRVAPQDDPGTR